MPSIRLLEDLPSLLSCQKSDVYLQDEHIDAEVCTDSRLCGEKQIFVALVGDKFNGHQYIQDVLLKNPLAIIYSEDLARDVLIRNAHVNFFKVKDTLLALQEFGLLHRKKWAAQNAHALVIGITGSNGKTTHKEMLAHLLQSIDGLKVLKTSGNLNNHIGVPLTLLGLKEHDVAIVEMGMNHSGEIKALCDIALPMHGLITNIGQAHIEFLKSIESIFKEKASLYEAVLENSKGQGQFVVCSDDPYLRQLSKSVGLTTFGENSGDISVVICGQKVSFAWENEHLSFVNENILEKHNLKNLVATILLALKLFPNKKSAIIKAASTYVQPQMNRSQWMGHIYMDAYNANPSSMRVSLGSFVEMMQAKKVDLNECLFVLGDMNELGEFAPKLHREIGSYLNELNISQVIFIGRYREFYLDGYQKSMKSFQTKEEFFEDWKKMQKQYKFIFVKASRSLQLESLVGII